MIPGVILKLGEREFTVPPLTIGQLRNGIKAKIDEHDKLAEKYATNDASLFDVVDIKAQIILSALRRNYKDSDISDSEFFDNIDIGSINDVWLPVMFGSGMRPLMGVETPPVNGASNLSTPPSAPPTVGT